MNFTCTRKKLQDAVNSVSKAISNNPIMPVLGNISIKAKDSQIIFRGYDLEIGIEHIEDAFIKEEGEILVNARLFSDIVRSLGEEEVEIFTEDSKLVIISGNAVFNIRWLDPAAFPKLPYVEKDNKVTIKTEYLKNMIRNTLFSVSTNEQRLILTGALFESEENSFKMVTLDSFRMSIRKEYILGNKEEFNFVIPGKTLNELLKLITNDDEDIKIYYEKTQVLFEFGNCKFISKLLQGDYFNYKAIIPTKDFATKIEISVNEFRNIIERNMLVSDDGRKAPLILEISENILTANTQGEVGNVTEKCHIKKEGKDIRIGFNARYLLDAIKSIDEGKVRISFMGETSACIITPLNSDEFLYLILPVRISAY
ncbi:MAG TPA: DNA polymerase III subunit beta [Clostridia bacterium]|jgi:DNA polymerase-3 subunit beta|nr:DNA polymerase III subunit beta [Clostridia bacterium]